MSKPDEAPIIFTYNNTEYRSTLKATKGRGRNSVVTIKKVGNSSPISEVYLDSIPPLTEIKIFHLISQGWWIGLKVERRGDDFIRPDSMRQFKYLIEKGMEERHSLRSVIVLNYLESSRYLLIEKHMQDEDELSIEALFDSFSSLRVPIIYNEKDETNFEVFLTIALRSGIEIAKEIVKSAGKDGVRLRNLMDGLNTLAPDSVGRKYIPKLCSPALKSLQHFRSVANLRHDKNASAILKFLSEIPESTWDRIEVHAAIMRKRLPLTEHLDERDASLWMQNGKANGMLDLMSRSAPFLARSNRKIFCILMNRYGLENLICVFDIFRSERAFQTDDLGVKFNDLFVNLLSVATFIEAGGDPSIPISWMIDFSHDADNGLNEGYNLDSIV